MFLQIDPIRLAKITHKPTGTITQNTHPPVYEVIKLFSFNESLSLKSNGRISVIIHGIIMTNVNMKFCHLLFKINPNNVPKQTPIVTHKYGISNVTIQDPTLPIPFAFSNPNGWYKVSKEIPFLWLIIVHVANKPSKSTTLNNDNNKPPIILPLIYVVRFIGLLKIRVNSLFSITLNKNENVANKIGHAPDTKIIENIGLMILVSLCVCEQTTKIKGNIPNKITTHKIEKIKATFRLVTLKTRLIAKLTQIPNCFISY